MTADREALKLMCEDIHNLDQNAGLIAEGAMSLLAELKEEEQRAEFWNDAYIEEQGKALDLKTRCNQLMNSANYWKENAAAWRGDYSQLKELCHRAWALLEVVEPNDPVTEELYNALRSAALEVSAPKQEK